MSELAHSMAKHLDEMGIRPKTPPGGFDGAVLCRSVSKERWCVTKKDLKHLRKALRKAIGLSLITPTERDPFDPDDDFVGPNVYTINDQFIKPVTAVFGNVSWALMFHPEGLKCDLFITHAWMEGMFEFIAKVLNAWPRHCHHAYCCMLSNPQNLDISDLIASPADSPFAKALHSADTMIVVPNCTCSIYSRLWCVYEAFLAVDQGKLIETATTYSRARVLQSVITISILTLLGVVLGFLCACLLDGDPPEAVKGFFSLLVGVPLLLSMVLGENSANLACNCLGAVACSFWSYYCGELSVEIVVFSLIFYAYFILSEMDRICRLQVHASSSELAEGFTGSVRDAECSSPADRDAISLAIGDKMAEVDFAIEVLRLSGMSTPTLREASLAGVRVPDAGLQEFATIAIKHPSTFCFALSLVGFHNWLLICLGLAMVALEITWTAQLIFYQRDRRALHLKMAHRMFVFGLPLLIAFRLTIGVPWFPLTSVPLALGTGLMICASQLLATLLSALGINRIRRLPCGRFLVYLFVARGFCKVQSWASPCCCKDADFGSDGEGSDLISNSEEAAAEGIL